MTRKSKRELERLVEDLDRERSDSDGSFDAREGVTAGFVSYEDGELGEEGVADGWMVSTTETASGAVFHTVEREAAGGAR